MPGSPALSGVSRNIISLIMIVFISSSFHFIVSFHDLLFHFKGGLVFCNDAT
jgi:hypothetical protein